MSSFAFAPLLKFFVGGGSLKADVPPQLRSMLFATLLMWSILPGAGWGLLVGSLTPVDRETGPLAFWAATLSGLCGICCAWATEWERVRHLQSGQINLAVMMSVGILLFIVLVLTRTGAPMMERLIRGK